MAALTLMWTGLFSRAAELIESMRRAAATPGVTTFMQLTLKTDQAMHGALTADSDACLKAMREGLELARATGVHTWSFQLLAYGYGGALARQDLEAAAGIARQLETHVAGAGRFDLCLYHHFQAWEAMLRKDLMGALQLEKTALRMAIEVGCPTSRCCAGSRSPESLPTAATSASASPTCRRCATSCAASIIAF